jgi:hypothetical protein
MNRRPRSDSLASAINAFQAPAMIDPPEHVILRDHDLPFWRSIISVRPASSWNGPDLEMAANLARCKADVEQIQRLLSDDEFFEQTRQRRELETLMKRAVYLSRMLHVHAEATQGASREQKKREVPEADARASVRSSLIPRLAAVR